MEMKLAMPQWHTVPALLVLAGMLQAPAVPAAPLYEVQGQGNRIVLLGSIHFLRASDGPLSGAVTAALGDADVVYMELDLDDTDPAATAATLAELARDPKGRDLGQLLGDRAWSEAQAAATALGLDLGTLQPFEPWYAALAVSQLRMLQLGFDPAHGIEAQLAAAARATGKDIRGLETLAEQLAALDGLSPGAQRTFLLETLADAATISEQVDSLLTAWRAGDARALEEDLLADLAGQDEVYRRVVVDRNRRFASTIADLAGGSQDYLVVMGALHLVGKDGVPRLLEAKGLKVRPLTGEAR